MAESRGISSGPRRDWNADFFRDGSRMDQPAVLDWYWYLLADADGCVPRENTKCKVQVQ